MKQELIEKRGEQSCPLCRDSLGEVALTLTCAACHTAVHRSCAEELSEGRCSTLGCGRPFFPPAELAPNKAGQPAPYWTPLRIALVAGSSGIAMGAVTGSALLALVGVLSLLVVGRLLSLHLHEVCGADEALILLGRQQVDPVSGATRGYRILLADHPHAPQEAFRIPVLETVTRLTLAPLEVRVQAQGVLFRGGDRAEVSGAARVAVSRDLALLSNAIERFVGQHASQIKAVAANTLEGHLRAACAGALPGELASIEREVRREALGDLNRLGLELQSLTLKPLEKLA